MFQVPAFVCTLNGNFYRVITVFTVNCGNGCRKTRLFSTVDGIEKVSLYGCIGTDVPNYHTCLLV